MAKERLSKLQKWILIRCYESKNKEIWRKRILEFFGCKIWEYKLHNPDSLYVKIDMKSISPNKLNSAQASITRSLKDLYKKGYIDLSIGWYGGSYCLEDEVNALKANIKSLKEIKEGEPPRTDLLTGLKFDSQYYEILIMERKKRIRNKDSYKNVFGKNIKRIKLRKKGIRKVESLMLRNMST